MYTNTNNLNSHLQSELLFEYKRHIVFQITIKPRIARTVVNPPSFLPYFNMFANRINKIQYVGTIKCTKEINIKPFLKKKKNNILPLGI